MPRGVGRTTASPLARLAGAVESLSLRGSALLLLGILSTVYLLTATYGPNQSVDTAMTSLSAWSIAERGTLDLADHAPAFDANEVAAGQVVTVGDAIYPNRFPGAIVAGVPFYLVAGLLGQGSELSFAPAGAAAAVIAALAVTFLHLSLCRLTSPHRALAAALAFGLATSTWSVSADALWTHGPAQLSLAGGMAASAYGRLGLAGSSWGAGILVRPHLAVIPAVAGLTHSITTRRLHPALMVASASVLGVAAWLAYGRLVFGQWTLLGGYTGGPVAERLVGQSPFRPLVNLWWLVVHPVRGFLPWTPCLLALAPALPTAWRHAPLWVRSSALGGIAYLAAQAWINRWSGGVGFWAYRYPLEMLTLTAPLWLLAYLASPDSRRRTVVGLVLVGVALQVPGAVLEIVM